ncbi:MOSC domain-containing protein [Novosphingobium sp. M1R2S20]|uniref:MOSC domain-containing protein n=1 Tax=Novosphingobium rhizovicinum TaxID=3228928 RepID=A0ABV3RHS7_9SPHN
MELLDTVFVTVDEGVQGDLRGRVRPGARGRRQVSVLEAESWACAMAELGLSGSAVLPWHTRRTNFFVEGLRFPRDGGYIVSVGDSLRIRITLECDPCGRMDELWPGLEAALTPDWRGGLLGRVIADGTVAIGDEIRIET